jgi:hypothetical protein
MGSLLREVGRKSPGFVRFSAMTCGLPAGATGRNRLSLRILSPDLWTAAMQYGIQEPRISATFRGMRRGVDSHCSRVPSTRARNVMLILFGLPSRPARPNLRHTPPSPKSPLKKAPWSLLPPLVAIGLLNNWRANYDRH